MKQSILLLIRTLSKNLRELFNARGLRCQTRGCCCCMTMPHRMQLMRQWIIWNDGAAKFLNTSPTTRIWHLRTFVSSPTSSFQAIQITWWCQAWGANMVVESGSHLLSTGFWEMDFPPRQVPQSRKWLCGKI